VEETCFPHSSLASVSRPSYTSAAADSSTPGARSAERTSCWARIPIPNTANRIRSFGATFCGAPPACARRKVGAAAAAPATTWRNSRREGGLVIASPIGDTGGYGDNGLTERSRQTEHHFSLYSHSHPSGTRALLMRRLNIPE